MEAGGAAVEESLRESEAFLSEETRRRTEDRGCNEAGPFCLEGTESRSILS